MSAWSGNTGSGGPFGRNKPAVEGKNPYAGGTQRLDAGATGSRWDGNMLVNTRTSVGGASPTTKLKAAGGMSSLMAASDAALSTPGAVMEREALASDQRVFEEEKNRRRGRVSTMLTGGQGLMGAPQVARRVLLGA
jgi:hypothetical protein